MKNPNKTKTKLACLLKLVQGSFDIFCYANLTEVANKAGALRSQGGREMRSLNGRLLSLTRHSLKFICKGIFDALENWCHLVRSKDDAWLCPSVREDLSPEPDSPQM